MRGKVREPGAASPLMLMVLILSLIVLFIPLAVIILLSFNQSSYGELPFQFTFKWYRELFQSTGLISSTWVSVQLSFLVTVTAAVLGTATAIWLTRRSGRVGALLLNGALLSALTVPWLILGIAMLLVVNAMGLGRSLLAMYLGLVAITVPYVVFVTAARLNGLNRNLEDAARSLGASPIVAYLRIVVPLALPAVAGGSLMCFMVSFNNFLIQFFLAPFGVRTLPLELYTLIRVGYQPDINALATLIVGATVLLIALLSTLGIQSKWFRGG